VERLGPYQAKRKRNPTHDLNTNTQKNSKTQIAALKQSREAVTIVHTYRLNKSLYSGAKRNSTVILRNLYVFFDSCQDRVGVGSQAAILS
jgi:hypothetical protein